MSVPEPAPGTIEASDTRSGGEAPAFPRVAPVDAGAISELQRRLGVSVVTAQALARRGLADADEAARWFGGSAGTQVALPDIDAAVDVVMGHIADGSPIVVHGDYDVDGVCGTTILLDVLELLGADPQWHLPKRGVDGYGLTGASLQRIGRLGSRLVITVDCGITSVEETARLRAAGVDVLITDHHLARSDGELPATTILHPAVDGGALIDPVSEPCGAGVAAALAFGLLDRAGHSAPALRDGISELVALATIADCVPLTGANRSAVRDGLAALARTRRPGLRALLRKARVDSGAIDGQTVSFRLAPRLNAAGRMARADLALGLLRAQTPEDGARLCEELELCNVRRREAERVVRGQAMKQVREIGERAGYVVAGEDWPAGVIGIVAARIAEETGAPAVVVSLSGDTGTGSARSAGGIDLAAALGACSEHLERFGGHAQAAGCEVTREALPALADAFDAAARKARDAGGERVAESVDAVAEVGQLTLSLADELAAFEPTGEGNPPVRLLLPSVRIADEQPMGSGGVHRRAVITGGAARSRAVAFNMPALPVGQPVDVVAELERSAFGGTVEARLLIRSVHPRPHPELGEGARAGIDAGALAAILSAFGGEIPRPLAPPAPTVDRRDASAVQVLRAAQAAGREVIAYASDPGRRAAQLRALGFMGTVAGPADLESAVAVVDAACGLVVCVDPPLDPRGGAVLAATPIECWWTWSEAELTFSVHVLEREFALRPAMVALFRALRDASGPVPALALPSLLADQPAAAIGRGLRVLTELGLADAGEPLTQVALRPGAGAVDADASPSFRAGAAIVEEAHRWIASNRSSV